MSNEKKEKGYVCDHCHKSIIDRGNYYRHKKRCHVKIEEEKNYYINSQQEKILYLEKTNTEYIKTIDELKSKIAELSGKIDTANNNINNNNNTLISTLCKNMEFMQDVSKTTLTKSMDALTFLMNHRKKAPELKQLTNENVQAILKSENRLYDYLLFYNEENMLDQYVGKIILKHIKKENPDDQSIWNSDVSRLTYIIRDVVNSSPTWLRDPKGALFNEKIITPIINELKEYLYRCVHSDNPDKVMINIDSHKKKRNQSDSDIDYSSSDESEDETPSNKSIDPYAEHEIMRRRMRILAVVNTLRSIKHRKKLSEYIATNIPLHKVESTKKASKQKVKKCIDSDSLSEESEIEKPKKSKAKK